MLDYLRANVPFTKETKEQGDNSNGTKTDDNLEVSFTPSKSITVQQKSDIFKVIATKLILQQRKIVACILHNVDLSNPKVMKKFLHIQTS